MGVLRAKSPPPPPPPKNLGGGGGYFVIKNFCGGGGVAEAHLAPPSRRHWVYLYRRNVSILYRVLEYGVQYQLVILKVWVELIHKGRRPTGSWRTGIFDKSKIGCVNFIQNLFRKYVISNSKTRFLLGSQHALVLLDEVGAKPNNETMNTLWIG